MKGDLRLPNGLEGFCKQFVNDEKQFVMNGDVAKNNSSFGENNS